MKATENKTRNPNWARDETILALSLYFSEDRKILDDTHPKVIALSEELNRISKLTSRVPTFRNPNGVKMKLANLASLDPLRTNVGKKGLSQRAKLDDIVWEEFASDINGLHKVADAIRSCANTAHAVEVNTDNQWAEEAIEGRILTRVHRARERDSLITKKKKLKVLSEKGELACEVCSFVFESMYGERGSAFIECHHRKPLNEYQGEETTRLEDLVLLCANCHRMIHAKRPWLTIEELKTSLVHR